MKLCKAVFFLALGAFLDGAAAVSAAPGLIDPDGQPKFTEPVVEAFKIDVATGTFKIGAYSIKQETGLIDPLTGKRLVTPVFGYGTSATSASWPGPTLEAKKDAVSSIQWENNLVNVREYPFTSLNGSKSVLDASFHWAYSLPGFQGYSIAKQGIPIVPHLHGGHSTPDNDGNPESFYAPGWSTTGPEWKRKIYQYPNDRPAGMLWYHDHTLGLTRLNVYAGLAGVYLIRDSLDTGKTGNPLKLPAGEFEKAYVIQDRMFKTNGELFVPAYNGEPYYADFIDGEEAMWDSDVNGPTGLAEFFGDFMLVNDKIWPKQDVKPRRYRLRLLNGCDSRYLVIKFFAVKAGATKIDPGTVVSYTVVGADQGLIDTPIPAVTRTLIAPGARLDIVINFSGHKGQRIIIANYGGDEAFEGDIPGSQFFNHTTEIMAFDVNLFGLPYTRRKPSWNWTPELYAPVSKVRRVGLFEGRDSFDRLQPLLGGERDTNIVETFNWNEPTTEKPGLNQIEEWEIYNFSEDAHPIHLHLVRFKTVGRYPITFDSTATEDGLCNIVSGAVNGVCLKQKNSTLHDGTVGVGYQALFPSTPTLAYDNTSEILLGEEYLFDKGGCKDVVIALPGQVTKIRAKFDKPGIYVWHCHILSHEDHEMMRRFEVS